MKVNSETFQASWESSFRSLPVHMLSAPLVLKQIRKSEIGVRGFRGREAEREAREAQGSLLSLGTPGGKGLCPSLAVVVTSWSW